jgi:hypothetical protein
MVYLEVRKRFQVKYRIIVDQRSVGDIGFLRQLNDKFGPSWNWMNKPEKMNSKSFWNY